MSVTVLAPDDTVRGVLVAARYGIDAEEYLACIAAGASHNETMGIGRSNVDMAWYARVRGCGATHGEALEIVNYAEKGVEVELWVYERARRAGATHAEVLSLAPINSGSWAIDCEWYCRGLEAGVTHDELVESCANATYWTERYVQSRLSGASHDEMMQLIRWTDDDQNAYWYGRNSWGISHEDLYDALTQLGEGHLIRYVVGRRGITHDEALIDVTAALSWT